jgi:hypothetical protein
MWEDNRYFWVVLCKNRWFHMRDSLSLNYRQRIPLGETDSVTACPIGVNRSELIVLFFHSEAK